MTISIHIKNDESADDMSKELLIETINTADGFKEKSTRHHVLRGGEEMTVTVYATQDIRLSDRFVDKVPTIATRRD